MKLPEVRCECGRLLGRILGYAEIKCPKCHAYNRIATDKSLKLRVNSTERPERHSIGVLDEKL